MDEARFRVRMGDGERSCILRVTRGGLLRDGVVLGLVGVVSPSFSPDGADEMGSKSEHEVSICFGGGVSIAIDDAPDSTTKTSSAEESSTSMMSDSEARTGEEMVVISDCLALS